MPKRFKDASPTHPPSPPVTVPKAAALKAIRRRFDTINAERLRRLGEALTARQRGFIRVLPLLLNGNHPLMPGFVSRDTPRGIAGYSPDKETRAEAVRLAKSFRFKRCPTRDACIEAVFVVGSPGTIGYSDKSDFDIWLCHRPDLSPEALDKLREKARRIKTWAGALNLEVHFFVMSARDVREGRHEALSTESSGTAQRHLLLDEFYRTALLLAGRYPLWWLIPPHQEHQYAELAARLVEKSPIRPEDVIDFGGLADIPANEFLGAALWQLYKGISSPHKSLLKILLIEAYASEFPNIRLISQVQKTAIYAGQTEPDEIDPYRLMMEKVESYLHQRQDPERLELARRSFYMKAHRHLGRKVEDPATGLGPLRELTRRWGWNHEHLRNLERRDRWQVEQVQEERRMLVSALTHSYRFLSRFARESTDRAAISEEDMNILGRRLFAAFERRTGKVELFGKTFGQRLIEPRLCISRQRKGDMDTWLLTRTDLDLTDTRGGRAGNRAAARSRPMKRARSLVELLAWCHFNGIAGARTQFTLSESGDQLSVSEVEAILKAFQKHFPLRELTDPPIAALALPSRPMKAMIIVNAGIDPLAEFTRQGRHLTSARIDPLNFGNRQDNLALTFDYALLTSWQEVSAFRFEGLDGLMACLGGHLQQAIRHPVPLSTYCFSPDRGRAIAQRIERVFADATAAFCRGEHRTATRYVLRGANQYYVLFFSDEGPTQQRLGEHGDLVRYLSQPSPIFSPVLFDRHAETDSPLPAMFRLNRAGLIQVFLKIEGRRADINVIDEKGSLFQDRVPIHDRVTLLNQYSRFLNAVMYRENASPVYVDTMSLSNPLQFYMLEKGRDGLLAPKPLDHRDPPESTDYVQLQVISELVAGKVEFTLYCDDREFSTLEFGKDLFKAVAGHVLSLRNRRAAYPIYITDIDLSGISQAKEDIGTPQTLHYLRYKKRLEAHLNEALSDIKSGK